jgi:hypothetical protein
MTRPSSRYENWKKILWPIILIIFGITLIEFLLSYFQNKKINVLEIFLSTSWKVCLISIILFLISKKNLWEKKNDDD